MLLVYLHDKIHFNDLVNDLNELITDGEFDQIDTSLRTYIYLIEQIEEKDLGREFNHSINLILQAILQAFTNEEIGTHGRE